MGIIAEFRLPTDSFPLGRALETIDDRVIYVETGIPIEGMHMPYIWARGTDFDSFEAEIHDDPAVEDVIQVDRLDNWALYRIEWIDPGHGLIEGLREAQAQLLEAQGGDHWEFRVLFRDHAGLAQFHNYCQAYNLPLQVDRVSRLTQSSHTGRHGALTSAQEEALRLGVERGYFSIPRETSAAELGEELGISDHAFIDRVRRGVGNLAEAMILEPPETTSEDVPWQD
jgi:predicted DNA binding protein